MAQRRGKTLARYGRAGVLGGVGDCWLDSDVIPPSVDSALKFAVKCLRSKVWALLAASPIRCLHCPSLPVPLQHLSLRWIPRVPQDPIASCATLLLLTSRGFFTQARSDRCRHRCRGGRHQVSSAGGRIVWTVTRLVSCLLHLRNVSSGTDTFVLYQLCFRFLGIIALCYIVPTSRNACVVFFFCDPDRTLIFLS